jgi:dipeptidyl aminopeptidase/acylaminoacyl peptidase
MTRSKCLKAWLALLLLLIGMTRASADADRIPISDFARLAEYETAKISPDGERIAVVMRRAGRRMLVTLDLATLELVGHVNFNPPNEVLHFHWVGDDRLLVSLAITLGALDAPVGTGELYGVNADGSQSRLLFGVRAGDTRHGRVRHGEPFQGGHQLLSLLPQDPRNVLITRIRASGRQGLITDVAMLDVFSGRTRLMARAPVRGARFVADTTGSVRFAVGHNAALELEMYHRDGSRWERVARMPFASGGLNPVGFDRDNRRVYVIDTRGDARGDGRDTHAARLLDMESGEFTEVFQHPQVDFDRVLVAPDEDVAYGLRYIPGRPRYHLFDEAEPYRGIFQLAKERFPDAYLDLTSITRDGRYAVLRVETDRDPGTLYLVDVERDAIQQMLWSRRWLDPERMAAVEPIEFAARDGTLLSGYLTRPADAPVNAPRPPPLVVLPHGGPHFVRDDGRFDDTVQLLAHHGYAVLQVNFRGSGGYGRAFQEAGYGQWHGLVLDDIEDGIRWATAAGHGDADRICAVGFSFGAYAAAMGAVRYPDRYRCVAGVAGVYDLKMLLEEHRPGQAAGEAFLRAVVGTDGDALAAASPAHQASAIRAPVLLIHGVEDRRAPVEHARRMRAALEAVGRSGDTVDYLEVPREGHGFYALENRVRTYERLLAFLARHLGT